MIVDSPGEWSMSGRLPVLFFPGQLPTLNDLEPIGHGQTCPRIECNLCDGQRDVGDDIVAPPLGDFDKIFPGQSMARSSDGHVGDDTSFVRLLPYGAEKHGLVFTYKILQGIPAVTQSQTVG